MEMESEVSTDQLLERARQRRLKLSKMLNDASSHDDVPRKRRTPLSEDHSDNLPDSIDDSPKRTCVREEDIHTDTPAISSVKSRMDTLMQHRAACTSDSPSVQPPHKFEDTPMCSDQTGGHMTSSSRKNRLAGLARKINDWEDESNIHPVLPESNIPTTPRQHTVKLLVHHSPVNSPGVNDSPPPTSTTKSVLSVAGKFEPPQKCDSAIKSRLNSWEQKIGQDQAVSAKKAAPVVVKQLGSVKELGAQKIDGSLRGREKTVPADDNGGSSVSKVRDNWKKMDENNTTKKEDEPTAYSVSARMCAWEKMTTESHIGQIKRVDPNMAKAPSPSKPPRQGLVTSNDTPACVTPGRVVNKTGITLSTTPHKTLTPSKSLVDCSGPQSPASPGASKYNTLSPTKASFAMKAIQQRLVEQTQAGSDIAQRLRDERMAELKELQNRWKNGVLRDPGDEAPVSESTTTQSEPSTIEMATKFEQREAARMKARQDFDDKLSQIGLPSNTNVQPSLAEAPLAPPPPPMPHHLTSNLASGAEAVSELNCKQVTCKPPMPPPAPEGDERKETFRSVYAAVKKSDSSRDDYSDQESESSAATNPSTMTFDDSFNSDLESERSHDPHTQQTTVMFRDPIESCADSVFSDEQRSSSYDHQSSSYDTLPAADDYLDEEDVSMAAFVPESVRRESMHFDHQRKAAAPAHAPQVMHAAESMSSLTSITSTESEASRDTSHDVDYTSDDLGSEESDVVGQLPNDDDDRTPKPAPVSHTTRKRTCVMAETETSVKMSGQASPLVYSISMYRYKEKRAAPKATIVHTRVQTTNIDDSISVPDSPPNSDRQGDLECRVEELQAQIYQEQAIITQTSNALNLCCSNNSSFAGSSAQVDCNRVLLVATQKRNVYVAEIQRIRAERTLEPRSQGPRGSLTISDIRLPLKKEFVSKIGSSNDNTTHYFIVIIKHRARIIVTEMLSSHDPKFRGSLDFPNMIKINHIPGNFQLDFEIYTMAMTRDQPVKDKKKARTPKKSTKSISSLPLQSPGGPNAVRMTEFTHVTSVKLNMSVADRTNFQLANISYKCPLYGSVYMRLTSVVESNVVEKGFLTMFEDVSGFGAWHRRWCVLSANKMCFWRYPDDVSRKEPICYIDLKRCITEKVGLIPRDICARPNTFELVTVHQPRKGEHDTLVSKTSSLGTQIRHMITADTKEERLVWCNQINKALLNLRTWNSDSLKPPRKTSHDRLV